MILKELYKNLINKKSNSAIGVYSRIGKNCIIKNRKTKIGKYCRIEDEVLIGSEVMPGEKLTGYFSRNEYKPVIIGNDVLIGFRSVIYDGIKIGNGAVIKAGAVVTDDVPDYAIIEGVPGTIQGYRFDEETIRKLSELKWWDYPDNFINKLPFYDVQECIKLLESNKYLRTGKSE